MLPFCRFKIRQVYSFAAAIFHMNLKYIFLKNGDYGILYNTENIKSFPTHTNGEKQS